MLWIHTKESPDRWTQFIWFHITQRENFAFIEMYLDILWTVITCSNDNQGWFSTIDTVSLKKRNTKVQHNAFIHLDDAYPAFKTYISNNLRINVISIVL